jgi:hypothetical protein
MIRVMAVSAGKDWDAELLNPPIETLRNKVIQPPGKK